MKNPVVMLLLILGAITIYGNLSNTSKMKKDIALYHWSTQKEMKANTATQEIKLKAAAPQKTN